MDRVGSDFFRVVEAIRTRLHANAVPVQIPIGAEKGFEGLVDLIRRKEIRFDDESLGETLITSDIDPVRAEATEAWRAKLIEAATECDDELLELYFAGGEIPPEKIVAAIRKGTLARKITPVLCGAALRNRGVQPLMDAECDYLPAPEDIGSVSGTQPGSGKPASRPMNAEAHLAALAFKTEVGPHGDLLYVRFYSGSLREGHQVWNPRTEKRDRPQKLYVLHANHLEAVTEAEAGSISRFRRFRSPW